MTFLESKVIRADQYSPVSGFTLLLVNSLVPFKLLQFLHKCVPFICLDVIVRGRIFFCGIQIRVRISARDKRKNE